MIVELGAEVLHRACVEVAGWCSRHPDLGALSVSVNLSARQLIRPELIGVLADALAASGLEPEQLCLEITESVLLDDAAFSTRALTAIKDLGVRVGVDDFGTGYSSLQYVQRFPIDIIKIDRSFVTGLGTNPGDGAVVQSMIELSQRLGVHTVAEGIDRPEQVTLLQSLGADLGQGYLFSKPVVADQITALLDASPHENPKFLLH